MRVRKRQARQWVSKAVGVGKKQAKAVGVGKRQAKATGVGKKQDFW